MKGHWKTGNKRRKNRLKMGAGLAAFALMLLAAVFLWKDENRMSFLQMADRVFAGLGLEESFVPPEMTGKAKVMVHFLDVGQGDSVLIRTASKAVLIDAGEPDQGQMVCDYLRRAGVSKLDLVIGSHPHADHIGGLPLVLEQFAVDEVLLPALPEGLVPTTNVFAKLLDRLEEKQILTNPALTGSAYDLGDGVRLEILAPLAEYEDLNNESVVCRLSSGEISFLFMGDAEKEVENDLLSSGTVLSSTVLKAGHHGSNTSSQAKFLDAVKPSAVVISCGAGNSYGHPHKEVLERAAEAGSAVYRTDLSGTIILSTDGLGLSVQVQKGEQDESLGG